MPSPATILSTIAVLAFSINCHAIVAAVFDPDGEDFAGNTPVSYGDFVYSGSQFIITFDTGTGSISVDDGGTITALVSTASVLTAGDGTYYMAFTFDEFSITNDVTIVITGDTAINGLAILSLGDFTLETDLSYSSAAGSNQVGAIYQSSPMVI